MVGVADNVIWIEGDLPAAARGINHIRGDGETGSMPAEGFDDLNPFADWRPKMSGSGDQVALVKIIRSYPDLHQSVHQLALDIGAVVDTCQEYGLVAKRNPRPG